MVGMTELEAFILLRVVGIYSANSSWPSSDQPKLLVASGGDHVIITNIRVNRVDEWLEEEYGEVLLEAEE
jgi:hypothetical protein